MCPLLGIIMLNGDKLKITITATLFVLASFFIILIFNACKQNITATTAPEAVNGVIDLRSWDFERMGPTALSGKWEFYWHSLLQPDDFTTENPPVASGLIEVPSDWNGFDVNGKKIAGYGYATYRLKILLGKTSKRMAFKFLDMAVAFSVYVNGKYLTSAGTPGKTIDTTVPQFHPHVVDFKPDSDRLDVIIQVSNFHHRKGGAWEVIHLGLADDIQALRQNALYFNFFLIGSILIMGIYHLVYFALRKKEKSALYFGIFCFFISARAFFTGERYIIDLLPNFDWEVLTKISYLTFYLGVPAFAGYARALFPKEFSKKTIFIINFVGILFSVTVLLTPAKFYTHTAPLFQIFTILAAGYGFYIINLTLKNKRQGAFVLLVGFVILFLTLVNDILYSNLLVKTGYMIQFGLFVFILSQAFFLSFRFSKAYSTIEEQGGILKATNISLKNEIAERKRTETEKIKLSVQLQQVQKMEAIATLAGGIAHQFNNAISVIVGNIELLCFEKPEIQNYSNIIDPIRHSVNRMTQLTKQLLAYARGGKFQVEEISIGDFISSTLPLIQYNIKSTISVKTDIPHDILRIRADLTQMQMVMSAIISNASEAIDSTGCIQITGRNIEFTEEDLKDFGGLKPGPYVCLKIEDDGKGMDEETRKRVFEPFFSTKFTGRGLGMAAAYGIIKNHDGWISISSELGKGTTVFFYLPAV
jgi:signal transduction histidine kinase